MNMYIDDETGYVIMDDIQEGSTYFHQSYIRAI